MLSHFGLVTLSIAIAVMLAGCGYGEAHFQAAWKQEILMIKPAIEKYWQEHGRLPDRLSDVEFPDPSGHAALVQYRRESDEQYVLWIRRKDIERVADKMPEEHFIPTPGEPGTRDVVGRFDVDGQVLYASWRSAWS